MKQNKRINAFSKPLLRFRHLAIIAACVAFLVVGPLCMVWKQVYITQLSIKRSALSDSVATVAKRVAQLRLSIDKLSSAQRIETIARQRLGLDYPAASNIVIVKHHGKSLNPELRGGIFAVLRKSVGGGRG